MEVCMDKVEIVGFVAGFIMIFSFLPQLVRTFKTKRATDISVFMYIANDMYCAMDYLWYFHTISIADY